MERIIEIEARNGTLQEVIQAASGTNAKKMYIEGDLGAGIVSCGQGIGLVHDIPTVKDLLDRIMKEAEDVIGKLSAKK